MRHRVAVWRQNLVQGTAQRIDRYTQAYAGVPCFIQPASSALQLYYSQRGTVVTHTIYTTAVTRAFEREDVLVDAKGNQYHLTADPLNALESDVYLQLVAEQYPEGAKKRLDVESFQ
ncbi:hypothetical protein GobsT_18530 [Gemmata obscuriglobus]|uniref:Uncharacterized protein n=1 Tax=Gemmata obscuriglobus TaxID=114 RepID=A0A2Z3H9V4_9BACT|nr:hypothetical protein [Gemmata obscuriglobus]AWM39785.1 hypothetical protein C1280_24120 [Gemmata obscuriglobus]QEG27100.1 hypothetical protein GobsT_18530 [Gemmata obscuriglobus]VTS03595.1 unnamed protein product [Gemmata obscuriglobus UQM 2246]